MAVSSEEPENQKIIGDISEQAYNPMDYICLRVGICRGSLEELYYILYFGPKLLNYI